MDNNYILLQEDTNANYEPTEEEVRAEAKYLGIAPEDSDLMWIAKEALRVSLSNEWHCRRRFPAIGVPTSTARRDPSCTTTRRRAPSRKTIPWMSTSADSITSSRTIPLPLASYGLHRYVNRKRSASNSFVPETNFSFASSPSRETRQHRFVFTSNVLLNVWSDG